MFIFKGPAGKTYNLSGLIVSFNGKGFFQCEELFAISLRHAIEDGAAPGIESYPPHVNRQPNGYNGILGGEK